MRNLLASGLAALALPATSQVVINEYSCSNISTVTDNFGQYEDWIELYNPSGSPVNLAGYYLSDNLNAPAKWTIGTASIPANGFLVIWCSARDINTGVLHANFKLTQTKPEMIILSDPSSTIVDSVTLDPAQADDSRGRTTNGAPTWSLFTTPTPNASNTGAVSEYATTPSMSLAAGFYTGSQSVTITSPDAGVTIRYTLDGSNPTPASTAYSGPLAINATTVVRARAFSSNPTVPPSLTESNTYFINVTQTMAVVSVFGEQLMNLLSGSYLDPITGIEYFDPSGVQRAESHGQANKHGNDSWFYPQRGIDFVSRDQYGHAHALRHKLFNMKDRTVFQRVILKAAANDNYPSSGGAHIRDAYVHTLSQVGDLDLDERTWEPCVVYANGQYWGVYELREKVDDEDFLDYYYNQFEPNIQMLKTWGGTWAEYGGAQAFTDWDNLKNFILGNNMAIQSNYDYVDSLLSVQSLTDYFVLNSFVVCSDWLNWNTAWWRGLNPAGNKKKWRYILWDEDATFGHYINYTGIPNQNPNADPCFPEFLGDPGGQGHVPIMNALLANDGFRAFYINRYVDLVNSTFNCQRMHFVLDSMINMITPEMPAHVAKWGGTMAQWQANVQDLHDYIDTRCNIILSMFDSCYQTTGPYAIEVNVDPPASGTVQLNTLHLQNFVWNGNYLGGIPINLTALPAAGYEFDYWEAFNHTFTPDDTTLAVQMMLVNADSIIAHFKKIPDPVPPMQPAPGITPSTYQTPDVDTTIHTTVPNAFSPNGDGHNDVIRIVGNEIAAMTWTIYNRWGEVVFSTNDPAQGWDGTFDGEPQSPGVFAYTISATLLNGERRLLMGNITLLR